MYWRRNQGLSGVLRSPSFHCCEKSVEQSIVQVDTCSSAVALLQRQLLDSAIVDEREWVEALQDHQSLRSPADLRQALRLLLEACVSESVRAADSELAEAEAREEAAGRALEVETAQRLAGEAAITLRREALLTEQAAEQRSLALLAKGWISGAGVHPSEGARALRYWCHNLHPPPPAGSFLQVPNRTRFQVHHPPSLQISISLLSFYLSYWVPVVHAARASLAGWFSLLPSCLIVRQH